jgi:hypothetical protein
MEEDEGEQGMRIESWDLRTVSRFGFIVDGNQPKAQRGSPESRGTSETNTQYPVSKGKTC